MKTWTTKSGYTITRILGGRSNVFLISNGMKHYIIDTSTDYMWKMLSKRLKKLQISSIEYLLLSHSHFDHAENAARTKERFGAKVIIHKSEGTYLEKGEFIIPHGTNMFTRVLIRISKKISLFKPYKPCKYDILVDDNFDLNDIGLNGRIVHTPGHTQGSISFLIDNEVAIVGDAMFGVFPWSVFPPFACDDKELVKSWKKLLDSGCTIFLPSHGGEKDRFDLLKDYTKRISFTSV